MLKPYTCFRSSAAYPVSISLNRKGLCYDPVPAHLIADDEVLAQPLTILEYLEETHREPPLLPTIPTLTFSTMATRRTSPTAA